MTGRVAIATVVALSILVSGPLAPLAAAQAPAQPVPSAPPTPPPPAPPPQPVPVTPQGELFQESLKGARAERTTAAHEIGAGVANVFYIPGKGILCGLGGVVGLVVLALTFGSGYKTAAAATREGCGGKWVLSGEDMIPDRDRPGERY